MLQELLSTFNFDRPIVAFSDSNMRCMLFVMIAAYVAVERKLLKLMFHRLREKDHELQQFISDRFLKNVSEKVFKMPGDQFLYLQALPHKTYG